MNEPALCGMVQTALLDRPEPCAAARQHQLRRLRPVDPAADARHAVADRRRNSSFRPVARRRRRSFSVKPPWRSDDHDHLCGGPAVASGVASVARLNGEDTRNDLPCRRRRDLRYRSSPACRRRRNATKTFSTSATTTRFMAIPAANGLRRRRPAPITSNLAQGKQEQKEDILGHPGGTPAFLTPPRYRWRTPTTRCANCAARSTARASASLPRCRLVRPGGSRSRRWASNWCGWRCGPACSRYLKFSTASAMW